MKYWVYILKSEKDSSFYIGYTNNLSRRLNQHNAGKSRYTSKKLPWKIVYSEIFDSKTEAIRRELFLKKQRNKDFYESLIKNWSGSSAG
ncbi:MAG: GIY-YIG nuclease family protein [Ekhidna sp.]